MYGQPSGPGCYGNDFDRYANRYDDSTIHKVKQTYWTAKHAIRSKLGKREDEHLVASDAELDAKLEVYYAIKRSCENLLRCIEFYQDYICDLSQEENALGRFLKDRGKSDRTQAGKMMAAVGRAQSYTAQQRLALRVPLVRLYQELEVFTERAVQDSQQTVDAMENARKEYRGSLLWMKNVSDELDPDMYKRLDKFRTVQAQVKRNKARFDKLKLDVLQKVDLLSASRCNLFSQVLANYQNCLMRFWDKTSKAHNTVSESFKGYQHYEFTIIKDLIEPSRKLAELTGANEPGATCAGDEDIDEKGVEAKEDQLISLEANSSANTVRRTDSLENLFRDSPDDDKPLPLGQGTVSRNPANGNGGAHRAAQEQELLSMLRIPPPPAAGARVAKAAAKGGAAPDPRGVVDEALLNRLTMVDEIAASKAGLTSDIAGADGQLLAELFSDSNASLMDSDFGKEWDQAFGSVVPSQPVTVSSQSAVVGQQPTLKPSSALPAKSSMSLQGLLPSQLLDLQLGSSGQQSLMGDVPLMSGRTPMPSNVAQAHAGPKSGGATGFAAQKPMSQGNKKEVGKDAQKMTAWFNLFAEIDPLQNPDALGQPEDKNQGV